MILLILFLLIILLIKWKQELYCSNNKIDLITSVTPPKLCPAKNLDTILSKNTNIRRLCKSERKQTS